MNTLTTTNVLLGIMTAMSLLEALALVAILAGGFLLLKQLKETLARIEERHLDPLSSRVSAILNDVKDVTASIKENTSRVDRAVRWGAKMVGL
jgi:pyrimidine operon attenuation protein/uracil phosphoribosyltransferase